MKPAVVLNTFDRPEAFSRLLRSLSNADIEPGTELVISIDGGGALRKDTIQIARSFEWQHGPSKVVEQEHLGLVAHFRACGDLVSELGAIVLLEDDLVVGNNFLRFAADALGHVDGDPRVAGISLSTPWFDGFRHMPFEPLLDGTAAIFAKVPWFHGMAWTPEQWMSHRAGLDAPQVSLPDAFAELDDDEWFPDAVRQLVADDRWYMLSRHAHAVNFGDAGVHFAQQTSVFQQPLVGGLWCDSRLPSLDDDCVVPYDEYMEPDARWLSPRVPELAGLDVVFDLKGVRRTEDIDAEWVVTSKPSRCPVRQWGSVMRPLEQNLLSTVAGESLTLCRVGDVAQGPKAGRAAERTVALHGDRGRSRACWPRFVIEFCGRGLDDD